MEGANRNRPFKIKISTNVPRPRPVGITARKDRAQQLKSQQNNSACVLQNKWRANKMRSDYNDLKSQPGELRWSGDVLLDGELYTATCKENFVVQKGKGLVTYTLLETSPAGKSTEPLRQIRESDRPLTGADAETNCRHLRIKGNGKLFIDYTADPSAKPAEEEVTIDKVDQVDDNDEQLLESYNPVPFSLLRRVQFCVDGAIGLPVNCTASRVSAQLMEPSRRRLGPLISSYTDPDSPMANPRLDLVATWRKEELMSTNLTILCRIDTLERPSLRSVAVGYAALKLCVDQDGLQPIGTESADGIKLNAGKFYIPINIGSIPEWGMLNEELIESLPPLAGAFLCVRLFEATTDSPAAHTIPLPNVHDPFNGANHGSGSRDVGTVADALYGSKVTDKKMIEKVQPLPLLTSPVGRDFQLGREISLDDRRQLMILVGEWVRNTFTPYDEINEYISKKYLLRYDDNIGFLACADGLHNMPLLKKNKKSHVVSYKVGFRYVCGEGKPIPWDGEPGDDPDRIIDDMSLQWDFSKSSERNVVFLDDFRPINKLQLGPRACVIVIVTRVIIDQKPSAPLRGTSPMAMDILVDINAREHNFWGILPIKANAPFVVPLGSPFHVNDSDGCFVNGGMHSVPLFHGTPPTQLFRVDDPMAYVQAEMNILGRANADATSGGGGCCGGDQMVGVSNPSSGLLLTNGASAIVRLQDGRLEKMAPTPLAADPAVYPSDKIISQLMKSFPAGSARNTVNLFKYNALRNAHDRTLDELIARSAPRDALMYAVNDLFEKEGREMLDSLR